MPDSFDQDLRALSPLLADLFSIDAAYRHGDRIAFSLTSRGDRDLCRKHVEGRLKTAGYRFNATALPDGPLLLVVDPKRRLHIPRLNIILFLATILTIYLAPVLTRSEFNFAKAMDNFRSGAGIRFTIALISILLVHEMGHYVAGRRRGIVTTWPFFIPAPTLIGTFGAVIRQKTPFWNRRDLLEVGAAGPIAGWIVAVAFLTYGLTQSSILPQSGLTPYDMPFSMHGESVLMRVLTALIVGPEHTGYAFVLSEYAFAGWVGLLVTAINLLPIGQLDGGHVLYGLLGRRQHTFGWIAVVGLLLLGFESPSWWFFAVLAFIFGMKHPPTVDDRRPPGRVALAMGVVSLVILLLSFTPIPFQTPEMTPGRSHQAPYHTAR